VSPFKRGGVIYTEHTDATGVRRRLASKARTMKEATILEGELKVQADRVKKGLSVGVLNPGALTLSEAAQKYLAKQKNPGTRASYEFTIGKHIDRSHLGPMLLEHVTVAAIEAYLEGMTVEVGDKEVPATPATQNRVRSAISGCFRTVIKLRLFHGANPVRDVEQRKEPEHTERLIPAALIPELLKDAPDEDWRTILAIAAYAGLRKSEIRRLDLKADVDLEAGIITVRAGKGDKVRRVGIHRELAPYLAAAVKRGFVPASKTWQKAHMVVKSVLEDDSLVFHGLRHTWASQLVECGAREGVVEYMGWGRPTKSTFRRAYLQMPASRLVEEVNKLAWPKTETPEDTGNVVKMKAKGE
jgi:integrase